MSSVEVVRRYGTSVPQLTHILFVDRFPFSLLDIIIRSSSPSLHAIAHEWYVNHLFHQTSDFVYPHVRKLLSHAYGTCLPLDQEFDNEELQTDFTSVVKAGYKPH